MVEAAGPDAHGRQRTWMVTLVFAAPALLLAWAILAALSTPFFLETGFLIGPLLVVWALTLFLLRDRIRSSGVLGKTTAQ